jgi:hypothetical protein
MCINFVGFIFLYFLQLFSPLFTSFTTFLSVIYVLFRFLYLFLFTCPLHWLSFCPFSFNGFLISKLFFPLVTFSFFHTKFSFVYFIVLLHFFPFCTLFIISVSFHFFLPGTFHFFSTWYFPFFFLPTLSISYFVILVSLQVSPALRIFSAIHYSLFRSFCFSCLSTGEP